MAVRCSKCGEELLGAVNRCWKCGQMFALRPEIDGRPPVRAEPTAPAELPIAAIVAEHDQGQPAAAVAAPARPSVVPVSRPPYVQPRKATTAELIDARRSGMMAMGGTVASLVLGVLSIGLAALWAPAGVIAILGLVMGIWGLYSPRRNLALTGMLLCCLGIGVAAYRTANYVYIQVQNSRPTLIEDTADPIVPDP